MYFQKIDYRGFHDINNLFLQSNLYHHDKFNSKACNFVTSTDDTYSVIIALNLVTPFITQMIF